VLRRPLIKNRIFLFSRKKISLLFVGLIVAQVPAAFAADDPGKCQSFLEEIQTSHEPGTDREAFFAMSERELNSLFQHIPYFRTAYLNKSSGILKIYCNPKNEPTALEFENIKELVRVMALPVPAKVFLVKQSVGRVDI